MKKSTLLIAMPLLASCALFPMTARAEWGTQTEAKVFYTDADSNGTTSMKAARTDDGMTFVSWLAYPKTEGRGFNVYMLLLDQDGNSVWDEPLEVENKLNASWTADYYLAATPDGNALVCWADARNSEGVEWPQEMTPVLYKVSRTGEQLWGEDGVTLDGTKYTYPPKPYVFGEEIYLVMESASETGAPEITRLAEDGSFKIDPVTITGQLVQSVGTDFMAIYKTSDGTVAMRYNQDIEKVWDEPALISDQLYGGYDRNPYTCVSDGQGGAFITFLRPLGLFGSLPIVQYISADGEPVFGEAADVLVTEDDIHAYTVMGVNTETEKVMTAWQISGGRAAIGGQMMDYFGERLWGDDGRNLAEKVEESGYTFGPMAIHPVAADRWCLVYADELGWATNQGYIALYNDNGEAIGVEKFGGVTDITSPKVYFVDDSCIIIYLASETDDDWNTTVTLNSVKIDNISQISGVNGIQADNTAKPEYFSIDGMRLAQPRQGLNIVRKSDGTVSKVMISK